MNIFISWSGELSKKIAELSIDFLQTLQPNISFFASFDGIDGGSLWQNIIDKKLSDTDFGLIFLSRENLDSPWILFETGALFKGLEKSRVIPILIDIDPSDLEDPMAKFQARKINETDYKKTILEINNSAGNDKIKEDIILKYFSTYWDSYFVSYNELLNKHPQKSKEPTRTQKEKIDEILIKVRNIERRAVHENSETMISFSDLSAMLENASSRHNKEFNRVVAQHMKEGGDLDSLVEKLKLPLDT